MGRGARDLRVPVAGPREVADVSIAVNELADALQHSESRQRDFLASVSHELRTPLAGISGQAQALADGLVAESEQAKVGRAIGGEAARMDRLVSDLLDLARLGADSSRLDLQPVDLTALVTDMARVWRRAARRRVPLASTCRDAGAVDDRSAPAAAGVRRAGREALRLLAPGRPLVLRGGRRTRAGRWSRCATADPGLAPEDYPVAFVPGELNAPLPGPPARPAPAWDSPWRRTGGAARRHDQCRAGARGRGCDDDPAAVGPPDAVASGRMTG